MVVHAAPRFMEAMNQTQHIEPQTFEVASL